MTTKIKDIIKLCTKDIRQYQYLFMLHIAVYKKIREWWAGILNRLFINQ